ncbi:MAG: transporter associated domain-containing protein, partial [Alphaproteobacteria bacterium]|nr:transporter associated domain-containing protein [Alphaproteobacteria bacterium]
LEVSDVMVHRRNMEMIDADLDADAIIERAVLSPHTRIPLWREDPDNIIGILHSKDLLRAVRAKGEAPIDITSLMVEPWFVPETTTLREQLNAFRDRRSHFALVVDEYGALMGIVTLEDILEEIVGEITDEHDIGEHALKSDSEGRVTAEGTVPIRDLNREFDWSLSDENATTIAGFVIHEAQTIPDPGQTFLFDGFKFEVLQKRRNQITLVRITPPLKETEEPVGEDEDG